MRDAGSASRILFLFSVLSDIHIMRIDINQLQSNNIEDPAVNAAPIRSGSLKGTSKASEAFTFNSDGIQFGHSEDNILSRERSKKKNVADQVSETSAMGVETQMEQMLVVAQTMSPQDAKKLSEEGYDMSSLDPSDAVNSLDRMKIKLAEAGVNVAGYTDTVSADKVAEVTGKSVGSGELSTNTVSLPESVSDIEELYFSPETTEKEIAETLVSFDLPTTNDNIESVKEAVNMASELKELTDNTRLFLASEGMEPTIANVFTAEFSSGRAKTGGNARYVADDTGYVGKAGNVSVADDTTELDRQIDDIIRQAGYETDPSIRQDAVNMINAGVPLTTDTLHTYEDTKNIGLRPLKTEVMDAIASGKRAKDAYLIADYKNVRAERVTKEAALSMSVDTNLKNLDKDITIDTGYLEKDVESLKAKEKEAFDLLERTMSVKSDVLNAPAEVISDETLLDIFSHAIKPEIPDTEALSDPVSLGDIHEKASDLTRRYEKLDQTYEAVGTEVRADLGDSIKKAFANTDFGKILKELGMEQNAESERAVRIASYSHMELSKENIEIISEADGRLNKVLDMLTPSRVLNLIRSNTNPLEIPLEMLEEKLTEFEDKDNRPAEEFAKYLVSERDKGHMTEDEATSYIGIYRFVNAINSGDHKAVGTLVASGAELSFSNLLSAIRTGNKGHIDRYIDESFSGLDTVLSRGNARIDQMIRTAFAPGNDASGQEAYEEETQRFAEAAKAEAEIYRALAEADISRSADNITAYEQLMQEGGNRFIKSLYDNASEKARERLKKAGEKTLNAFKEGDPDKIKESYDEMVKAELIGAFEGETLDIRALQSREKVLSVKSALAGSDEYNVPVEFKGEIININLKIKHGENQNSVDIYFETEEFGSVHAGLRVADGIRGAINCERTAGDDHMRERLQAIEEAVSNVSGKNTDLTIGNREIPDDHKAMDGEKTESAMLYRIAKAVLDAVLA